MLIESALDISTRKNKLRKKKCFKYRSYIIKKKFRLNCFTINKCLFNNLNVLNHAYLFFYFFFFTIIQDKSNILHWFNTKTVL